MNSKQYKSVFLYSHLVLYDYFTHAQWRTDEVLSRLKKKSLKV